MMCLSFSEVEEGVCRPYTSGVEAREYWKFINLCT